MRKLAKTRQCHPDLIHLERITGPCKDILNPIRAVRECKYLSEPRKSEVDSMPTEEDLFKIEEWESKEDREIYDSLKRSNQAKADFFDGN